MKKVFLGTIATTLFLAMSAYAAPAKTTKRNEVKQAPVVQDTTTTVRDTDGTLSERDARVVEETTVINQQEERSRISKGGLFIEPMLMATQEDQTIKTSQLPIVTSDSEGKANGYGLGLRFGGHVSEVFMLGADARYARVKMEDSFYNDADANIYNIAPTVGIQTPLFGIRVLGSYVLAGENDPEAGTSGLNLKFKEATGWRVGAGLHVAAVGISLEYQDLSYNTTEVESFGSLVAASNTNVDMESKGYALSLSFPVEL
jgi:hypothetical protein